MSAFAPVGKEKTTFYQRTNMFDRNEKESIPVKEGKENYMRSAHFFDLARFVFIPFFLL